MFSSLLKGVLLICSFAHTVTSPTSKPEQCEIQAWNIYRYTLEDGDGCCSVGSRFGCWGTFLSIITIKLILKESPRPTPTHSPSLCIVSCDALELPLGLWRPHHKRSTEFTPGRQMESAAAILYWWNDKCHNTVWNEHATTLVFNTQKMGAI